MGIMQDNQRHPLYVLPYLVIKDKRGKKSINPKPLSTKVHKFYKQHTSTIYIPISVLTTRKSDYEKGAGLEGLD